MVLRAELTKAEHDAAIAYVQAVINAPYVEGALGPDDFDCWGLLRDSQAKLFGRTISIVGSPPASLRDVVAAIAETAADHWSPVPSPQHGDAVTLSRASHPHHVGVWLDVDRGGVLHCVENGGVMFQTLLMLRTQGWSKIGFYRYGAGAAP